MEPVTNILCSSNRPVPSVDSRVRYVFSPKVDKVLLPEVDEVVLPEINKVSREPFASIFKCAWNILCPEIDEIVLEPVSNVFEDTLSLEVCFC